MSVFKNNFVVGVTAAMAATILAPVLIPAIKKSGRPLAKSLVKGGILLYEKGRETVASAGEMMEDVVAEVRAETMEKQYADTGDGWRAMAEEFQPRPRGGNGSAGAGDGGISSPFEKGGST